MRARSMREQAEVLQSQVEQAELALAAANLRRSPSPAGASRNTKSKASPEELRAKRQGVQKLRKQSDDLLRNAASRVLQSVQVVACTCTGVWIALIHRVEQYKVASGRKHYRHQE